MASTDEEDNDILIINSTQPKMLDTEKQIEKLRKLPSQHTLEKYEMAYEKFMKWNKNQSLSEDTLLEYFNELSKTLKYNTLWAIFSMLGAIFQRKHNIDLKTYTKVTDLLKKRSVGATVTKTPALPPEGIEKFLKEAPDYKYLSMKVALIFAITGACTSMQLTQITRKHIEHHGEMFLVSLPDSRSQLPRTFVIHGEYYEIVKKYKALRRKRVKGDRFFQTYIKGKCVSQPIGVNTFGAIPRKVAAYLGLPNPESYTAHSFKKTAMKMQAGPGWISAALRLSDINGKKTTETSKPPSEALSSNSNESTSMFPPDADQSCHENIMSPIYVDVKSNPHSRPSSPSENLDVQNLIQTSLTRDDNFTFQFNGCHFTNCFNK